MKQALLAAAIFISGMFAGARLAYWLDIDTCLDQGGAWDYQRHTCRYQ